MGDDRAEGSSAIGDRGHASMPLIPDFAGTPVCIFESSKLEDSYVGDLMYLATLRLFSSWTEADYIKKLRNPFRTATS